MCNAVNIVMGDMLLFVVILRISTLQRGWWSNSTARSSRDVAVHLRSLTGEERRRIHQSKAPRSDLSSVIIWNQSWLYSWSSLWKRESLRYRHIVKKKQKTSRAATSVSAFKKLVTPILNLLPVFAHCRKGPNFVVVNRKIFSLVPASPIPRWMVCPFFFTQQEECCTYWLHLWEKEWIKKIVLWQTIWLLDQSESLAVSDQNTGEPNRTCQHLTSNQLWPCHFPSQEHWQFMEGLFIDTFVYY